MKKILPALFAALSAVHAQTPTDDHLPGERHFHEAGIAVRLVGEDSLLVTVGAGSEDLQNTVTVFPYSEQNDGDSAAFRLLEQRLEAYLQTRIPVKVDGKRIYLEVTQWKPGGLNRDDRLDMKSLYVDNLFITLGGKLPPKRKTLEITANLWVERRDAGETVVQLSFFKDRQVLRRLWTKREKTVRFPLAADSLAAMLKNPPQPLQRTGEDHDDQGGHSGHNH